MMITEISPFGDYGYQFRVYDPKRKLYWDGKYSYIYDDEAYYYLSQFLTKNPANFADCFNDSGAIFKSDVDLYEYLALFTVSPLKDSPVRHLQLPEYKELTNPIPNHWVIEERDSFGETRYHKLSNITNELTVVGHIMRTRQWAYFLVRESLRGLKFRKFSYLAHWNHNFLDYIESEEIIKVEETLLNMGIHRDDFNIMDGVIILASREDALRAKMALPVCDLLDIDEFRKRVKKVKNNRVAIDAARKLHRQV